jgi:hypothetical protein
MGLLALQVQGFLRWRGPDRSGHVRVLSGDPNGNKGSTSNNTRARQDSTARMSGGVRNVLRTRLRRKQLPNDEPHRRVAPRRRAGFQVLVAHLRVGVRPLVLHVAVRAPSPRVERQPRLRLLVLSVHAVSVHLLDGDRASRTMPDILRRLGGDLSLAGTRVLAAARSGQVRTRPGSVRRPEWQ